MDMPGRVNIVEELIYQKHYKNAIEECLGILEEVLRKTYKDISITLSVEEKKKLLEVEEETGKGKSIDKLELGQLIAIFEKGSLFKKVKSPGDKDIRYFSKSLLHLINNIRVACTHHGYMSNEMEAHFVEYTTKNILLELGDLKTKVKQEESEDEVAITQPIEKKLDLNNMPPPDYYEFVGRADYIEEAMKLLTGRAYVISVDGIGGVGKSALAYEVALKCWKEKLFDAVVWVSAKSERLKITGIEDIVPSLTTYDSLIDTILSVLGFNPKSHETMEDKRITADKILEEVKTLLVVDNLETVDDQDVLGFLKELPDPSKALVTSRKRIGEVERVLQLKEFTPEESRELLEVECKYRKLDFSKIDKYSEKLHELTGGIPLALKIIVGWLESRLSVEKIMENLKNGGDDILSFCFKESYENLMDDDARKVFSIFPVLPQFATKEQIGAASMIEGKRLDKALETLTNLALLNISEEEIEEEKVIFYSMLPLTLKFSQSKLSEKRGLEKDARKALAKYFELHMGTQEALKQYGLALEDLGGPFKSEKGRMSAIIANLALATYQRGNYRKAIRLFKQAIKTDRKLSYSYQMWATVERQEGNYGKANELFAEASKLNPNNPIIWSSWAMLKKDEGDLISAENMLEKAQPLRPDNSRLFQQLAVVKSMLKKFDDAIKISKNKINKSPKSKNERFMNVAFLASLGETYFKWGLSYQDRQDLFGALEKFQEGIGLIEELSKFAIADHWRIIKEIKKLKRACGIVLRRIGEYDKSKINLQESLYSSPINMFQENHNREVYLDIVLTMKYAGEREDMIKLAEKCKNEYNDDRFIEYIK